MVEPLPAPLQAALADLAMWFETAHVPAMIIGGVAASVLGRPRLTRDIDALAIAPAADWADLAKGAARYRIVPRIEKAVEFARRSRVLLLRHLGSGIDVDVTFGALPFERTAVEKSATHRIGDLQVRLPRVEDLLVMKAIARRPKDLEDIRGLLATHPQADISAARRWVKEFATAMSMPDILEQFDQMVARRS